MNLHRMIPATLVYVFLLSTNLMGQTGSVSGQVTEANLKTALSRAQVSVNGSEVMTTTDDSGRYTLLGVPEGKVTIKASYLGLTSVTQEVQVNSGKSATLNFALEPALKTSVEVKA